MRILGIDPGSRATGYGLIEKQGNRLVHIDNGVILTGNETALSKRLEIIYRQLAEIITRYEPDTMAVEQIFLARNALSALKLGHARGVALLAGVHQDLPVYEYTALQVKSAVVGYGRAAKGQIQEMVKILLNLPEIAQEDASDALAVAVCHAHSVGLNTSLAKALGRAGR
ncbi:Holliday junction endonuclease RuvC [Geoalkalibacter ferrihydriticus]|uniref:Crossover junction endodeoxyribonuclease RuvC n=2 Tax=Geoalkalibacter ferrihydriticus TaxID=392333 RepID=A0A0C2HJ02_9BACT|nr:crossover junction endodeoxyribonuclease RuvC [Geoalkalibacter ferrihydriticus]KIH77036.1 Holliday junction resolvase [Geoalkalibacter ferrihydriticus DSM 17813]SDL37797.1 Holliday junction endonuclease RuvC [Geoalkalibacter ferrihydriticus]